MDVRTTSAHRHRPSLPSDPWIATALLARFFSRPRVDGTCRRCCQCAIRPRPFRFCRHIHSRVEMSQWAAAARYGDLQTIRLAAAQSVRSRMGFRCPRPAALDPLSLIQYCRTTALLPFLRSCSSPAATTRRAATYVLPHCRAETRASTSSTCTSDSGLMLDSARRASSERSLDVSQGFQAGVPCGFVNPSSVKRPVLSRSPRESPSAPLLLTVAATSRRPQQRAGVGLPTLFPHIECQCL